MPAPRKNQNAVKETPMTVVIPIRMTEQDAASLVEAARPDPVSTWARRKLIAAARRKRR